MKKKVFFRPTVYSSVLLLLCYSCVDVYHTTIQPFPNHLLIKILNWQPMLIALDFAIMIILCVSACIEVRIHKVNHKECEILYYLASNIWQINDSTFNIQFNLAITNFRVFQCLRYSWNRRKLRNKSWIELQLPRWL